MGPLSKQLGNLWNWCEGQKAEAENPVALLQNICRYLTGKTLEKHLAMRIVLLARLPIQEATTLDVVTTQLRNLVLWRDPALELVKAFKSADYVAVRSLLQYLRSKPWIIADVALRCIGDNCPSFGQVLLQLTNPQSAKDAIKAIKSLDLFTKAAPLILEAFPANWDIHYAVHYKHVKLDPNNAQAWVLLSLEVPLPYAREYCFNALRIDPNCAGAYCSLAKASRNRNLKILLPSGIEMTPKEMLRTAIILEPHECEHYWVLYLNLTDGETYILPDGIEVDQNALLDKTVALNPHYSDAGFRKCLERRTLQHHSVPK